MVRPGRRGATQRVQRDVLRNDAFERLRRQHAGDVADAGSDETPETYDEMTARRVRALAGDVSTGGLGLDDGGPGPAGRLRHRDPFGRHRELRLGPRRRRGGQPAGTVPGAEVLNEAGSEAHMIAVSTLLCGWQPARRGTRAARGHDSPFFTDVSWRDEATVPARPAATPTSQAGAPTPGSAGGPGPPGAGRGRHTRAVREGGEPAPPMGERPDDRGGPGPGVELGFPDAYAFTKALGERALAETRGDIAVRSCGPRSSVALAEPHPGWIRGFRMAEPVIAAYADGLLKEFPGVPEGLVDVIPVDLVVATILAVASRGPFVRAPTSPRWPAGDQPAQVRHALRPGERMVHRASVYDEFNQPIPVPRWSFPGRGRVARQCTGPSGHWRRPTGCSPRCP